MEHFGYEWRERLRRWMEGTGGRPWLPARHVGERAPAEQFTAGPLPLPAGPVETRELLEAVPMLAARRLRGEAGDCWELEWPAEMLPVPADLGCALGARIRSLDTAGADELAALHADMRLLAGSRPEDLLFFDLETLGLGNAGVFLIGFLTLSQDGMSVGQLFAQNYAEEGAIISAFAERLAGKRLVVTYNGKSFDMPLLSGRAALWRVPLARSRAEQGAPPLEHLDVLYECRRRWTGRLPDCRLQTVEQAVCGRRRAGDIPGRDIPATYHDFVASGDARLIAPILWHNALDLVSTAQILLACLAGESGGRGRRP